MKKFISLFVIAAVLAFAGMAFAADGTMTITGGYDGGTTVDVNNGAVTPATGGATADTTFYYFGTGANTTGVTLGVQLTTATPGSTSAAAGDKIVVTDPASGFTWAFKDPAAIKTDGGGAYKGTIAVTNWGAQFPAAAGQAITLDWQDGSDGTKLVASGQPKLTAKPAAVTFADPKVAPIELGAKPADFDLEIATDGITLNSFDNAPKAVVELNSATNADFTVTVSKVGAVTFAGAAKAAGLYTVKLQTSEADTKLFVDEGDVKGISVANIPASSGDDIFSFTFTVLPAATNSADIAGESKIEIVSGDAEGDIVISTDIVSGDPSVKSTDFNVFVDNVQIASCDIVVRSADKKYLDAVIEEAFLNTLKVGDHKAYVMKNDNSVRTDSVTITVIKPTPVPPTTDDGKAEDTPAAISADLPSGVQGVVIDNTNFATSTDVAAGSKIAKDNLVEKNGAVYLAPEYLSSDKMVKAFNAAGKWGNVDLTKSPDQVTSFQVVSVDVANEGAVAAIAFSVKGDTLVVSNDVNVENLNIYKVLSEDKVKRLSVAAAKDNETSADLKGKYRVYTGTSKNIATKVQKNNSYTLVVFVQDNSDIDLNSAAKQIVDPVVTIKSNAGGGHSSSSSCDLGFGLVAVAGLAALALRKRSK